MPKGGFLGAFEKMVLLAVIHLENGAYGMTIRREIESRAGRSVSIGARGGEAPLHLSPITKGRYMFGPPKSEDQMLSHWSLPLRH